MPGELENPILLTDDGISEEFFSLLWTKDELNFGPSINIPDTVVFKFGQPIHWYFTASNGRIKMKNRQNLLSGKIEEVFTKYLLGYDIVATFLSVPLERDSETGKLPGNTIRYFNRVDLNDFLFNSKKENHGILQRFIEPKGIKNEVIRAIWSPKVCLLERAENIHNLHDPRYGLYEKCVTFEGPEYYSASAPLRGPVLAGQIQKVCESVVSHIAEVTFSQKVVTRIVINFKVDSRDKLWMLYTTSIRCADPNEKFVVSVTGPAEKKLLNINSVVSLPDVVNLNPYKSYDKGKIGVRSQRIKCISCAKETLETLRHPITYKTIMKHYEHILHLIKEISGKSGENVVDWPPDPEIVSAAGGVGFGCLQMVSEFDAMAKASRMDMTGSLTAIELLIPPMLRYLHPKLTPTGYNRCKMDPLFLYKTANVCESCYLVYAEFSTMILRLGQDLTKLLKPDPSAASLTAKNTIVGSSLSRPSEADWKAMSSLNRSASAPGSLSASGGQFKPSKNHTKAKQIAIGIRSSETKDQPSVPSIIRDGRELKSMVLGGDSGEVMSQTALSLDRSVSLGSLGAGAGSFAPDNIQAMIAERERRFFKEISLNPQLRDQHPLMHLVSSQEKLKLADQSSGTLMTKEASKKEGLFDSKYGKQGGDKFDRFAAYGTEQPYIISGRVVSPTRLRREREQRREQSVHEKKELSRKKKALAKMAEAGELDSLSDASSATGGLHQRFLMDTIKQVRSDMLSTHAPPPESNDQGGIPQSKVGLSSSASFSLGSNSRPSTTSHQRRTTTAPVGAGGKRNLVSGTLLEGEDESQDGSLLRNWGIESDNESGMEAMNFSKHSTAEQKLREYGVGASDSLEVGTSKPYPNALSLSDHGSVGDKSVTSFDSFPARSGAKR